MNHKRAVVIGINYKGSRKPLDGCINDAHAIRDMLRSNGYTVLLMTDKTSIKPTYSNIKKSFDWLLSDTSLNSFGKRGNRLLSGQLYFHFSGHGKQTRDKNRDEPDRMDEALLTYDNKLFLDDDIHRYLVSQLPGDVYLRASLDCCNSRTNFDLKWHLHGNELVKNYSHHNDSCNVIVVTGASDTGSSYDTKVRGKSVGILTYHYIDIMRKNNYQISCDQLLRELNQRIKSAGFKNQQPGICFGRRMSAETSFSI
jgi:hypothetical protein